MEKTGVERIAGTCRIDHLDGAGVGRGIGRSMSTPSHPVRRASARREGKLSFNLRRIVSSDASPVSAAPSSTFGRKTSIPSQVRKKSVSCRISWSSQARIERDRQASVPRQRDHVGVVPEGRKLCDMQMSDIGCRERAFQSRRPGGAGPPRDEGSFAVLVQRDGRLWACVVRPLYEGKVDPAGFELGIETVRQRIGSKAREESRWPAERDDR